MYANDGPAARAFAVTPANTDFTGDRITRALYIGGTGDVSVVTRGGDTVTFVSTGNSTATVDTTRSVDFVADSTTTSIFLHNDSTASGRVALFQSVSVRQVT